MSAVSPDWLTKIHNVFSSIIGFLYLNSDAIATSTGILAKSSIATFPINPALYAVPHAIIYILSILSNSSFVSLKSPKLIFSFKDTLPVIVSLIAFGCSWISFNMKSSKPPFSAASIFQVTW